MGERSIEKSGSIGNGRRSDEQASEAVKCTLPMKADIDLNIGRKTFASGLLPELIAALRRIGPGDLVAVAGDDESIGPDLETWCRFTGNSLVEGPDENGRHGGFSAAERWQRPLQTIGPWAHGFGSIGILTAISDVTTVACAPRPPHPDASWGLGVCSASFAKGRSLA